MIDSHYDMCDETGEFIIIDTIDENEMSSNDMVIDPFAIKQFGKLSDREKLAFVLVNIVGISYENTGIVLGCEKKEVSLIIKSAKKNISEFLQSGT
jgi:DNA-directed RNA polymerase specialized sigma subunit